MTVGLVKDRATFALDLEALRVQADELMDEMATHQARNPKDVDLAVSAQLLAEALWKLRVARGALL